MPDSLKTHSSGSSAGKFTKLKFFPALIAVVAVLLVGLNLLMKRHCEALIIDRGLPWIEERCDARVTLEKTSLNLFSGAIILRNLVIENPDGFDAPELARLPYVRIRFAWLDLWRKNTVTIRSLRVKDAQLHIIRNRQMRFNLPVGTDDQGSPPDKSESSGRPEDTGRPGGSRAAPHFTLDKARINVRIEYIDYHPVFPGKPLQLNMNLKIHAANISNRGRTDQLTGKLLIDGDIEAANQRIPLEIRGKFAPVVAPDQLTFEITAATRSIDLHNAPPLADWLGLEQGQIAFTMLLKADQGIFDPGKSTLKFDFDKVNLTDDARRRMSGINLPRTFVLTAPVGGSLENPRIDLTSAVADLLTGSDFIGSLLQDLYEATGKSD